VWTFRASRIFSTSSSFLASLRAFSNCENQPSTSRWSALRSATASFWAVRRVVVFLAAEDLDLAVFLPADCVAVAIVVILSEPRRHPVLNPPAPARFRLISGG